MLVRAQPAVLAALLLWLLIGPRVELPDAHGLRVEDLVFVALAALCARGIRSLSIPRSAVLAIAAVTVTGGVSALVASARGMVDPLTSMLFAARPLEYWIAFPSTLLLVKTLHDATMRLDQLFALVTVVQTAFAVAQYYFQLPIGFSHAAYTRAAGLTVGPYELGAMSAALLVYWVARGRFTLASLAAIALTASISRVSLLGAAAGALLLAAAWLLRLIRAARRDGVRATALAARPRPSRLIAGAASIAAAGVVVAFTLGLITPPGAPIAAAAAPSAPVASDAADQSPITAPTTSTAHESKKKKKKKKHSESPSPTASPVPAQSSPTTDDSPPVVDVPADSIGQRLKSTSVIGSWNASAGIAAEVPQLRTSAAYQDTAYARLNEHIPPDTAAASGTEASNLVRFFRWHLLLDTFDGPLDVVFGLGPSFAGPSVDGSYLRMYVDGGLLGLIAWGALILTWLRRRPLWMVCVTISMLVGATFIDILYAERPMVLFWMMLAVAGAAPMQAARDRARHRAAERES